MTVVRAAALVAVPWANGGGVTRVIAERPGQFRLSLATIDRAGPFSCLPAVVRQFALVDGQVALSGAGPATVMVDDQATALTFSGNRPVHATPIGGPALALNLMVPVGAPCVRLHRCAGAATVDAVAIFASEPLMVDGVIALQPHDTALPDRPVQISGRALVVLR